MSIRKYVARQFDALFEKPPDEFKPTLSAPIVTPTVDPLKALMQKNAAKAKRGLTEQEKSERAKRRAEYDRKLKEKKRNQRALIRQRIKMTDDEIWKEAAAKKAEKKSKRIPQMSDGAFMTDSYDDVQVRASTGGFGPQKIDYMTGQADISGVAKGEGARKRVNPEGAGTGESSFDDNNTAEFYEFGGKNARPTGGFLVKMNINGSELQRVINYAVKKYFVGSVCRLCLLEFEALQEVGKHLVSVHGDENEPEHNFDFGDVLAKTARKIEREDKKRRKAALALNPETGMSEEDRLLAKAASRRDNERQARKEGMVQRGWTLVAGRGWQPNWVRDTRKSRNPV